MLEKTKRTTELRIEVTNENIDGSAFFDEDISLLSSVEAEEEQPEETETNQREQNDQTEPTHHGYSVSFDSMDSASASINSDIGIQTKFPKMAPEKMAPEDIENNDEKSKFYTGLPNYATFMLFFTTFLKHGATKLTY